VPLLRPADGGGFLGQFGLFVRIETGKEVKSLTYPDGPEIAEGISDHFSGLESSQLRGF
jgi:hypothetical protein